MKVNEFLNEVLAAAKAAGIDPAEVYYHGGDSFNVSALDGEISDYKVASSCGVSLRGMFGGKMGSASTEAFDADAVRQLIDGVKESATLLETDEQDESAIRPLRRKKATSRRRALKRKLRSA